MHDRISESEIFVVDIQIKPGNLIQVFLDQPGGISLDSCVEFSRLIESNLDREQEDFELQVSSPGLDKPLKVYQQYVKNVGKKIKIVLLNGDKYTARVMAADPEGVELEAELSVKTPGVKKKTTELKSVRLEYKDIKTAKVNLEF